MKKILIYLIASLFVLNACTTETVVVEPEVVSPVPLEPMEPVVVPPEVEEVEVSTTTVFDSSRTLLGQELLVPAMDVCRLPDSAGRPDLMIGFPIADERIPSIGEVKAMVFYVDFTNRPLNWTTNEMIAHFDEYGTITSQFYALMSDSRLTMEFELFPEVVTMEGTEESYRLFTADERIYELMFEAIDLVDAEVDFSSIDFFVFVINSSKPYGLAFPLNADIDVFVTDEGNRYNATVIGIDPGDWFVPGLILTHEVGHLFGLVDMYDYDFRENYDDYHRFVGGFDIMGFLNGEYIELLEWHRYLLGWVDDIDVACIPGATLSELEVNIGNSFLPNTQAMLIIQLTTTRALIVEPKLQGDFCDGCDGALIYTVDTSLPTGAGPVQIFPAADSRDPYYYDGLLEVGDELQVGDFLIRVIEGYTESFIVNVTKTN